MNIAIVGEAWGEKEEEAQAPFVGPSGWHLDQMLAAAGIDRKDCLTTNVFNLRPKRNDVKTLCGPKKEGVPGLAPIVRGKYLKREYASEIDRLQSEIEEADPNLILALGATALWAFTGQSGIKANRGVLTQSPEGRKVLPTYHPAAVLRQWTLRPIVIADLQKAERLSHDKEFSRPERSIWIEPTVQDLLDFEEKYFGEARKLACDIETKQNQITCIGFSPRSDVAIVIPFFLHSGENYWKSPSEELKVWEIIRRWLNEYPTVYQNGLYDMGYLWRVYGIPAPAACDDTMLAHHAQQPEMEKGLGFLASLYTDEASWKHMGKGKQHD